MRFSIIMPSYLGWYKGAAVNREQKLERAITSVLGQTFDDYELIIISDGCEKTQEIVAPYVYEYLPKIRLLKVDRQKQWAGRVRNAGIYYAKGDIITYLDTDDKFGHNHLRIINDGFENYDWVYYDDYVYNPKTAEFKLRPVKLVAGQCGTSNISHRRDLGASWVNDTYLHDLVMIRTLMAFDNYNKIAPPEYHVCHIPSEFDI